MKNKTMENRKLVETQNFASLPKGWEYGTLEDVVEKDSSNISLNKVKNDKGKYPLYSAKGFVKKIT